MNCTVVLYREFAIFRIVVVYIALCARTVCSILNSCLRWAFFATVCTPNIINSLKPNVRFARPSQITGKWGTDRLFCQWNFASSSALYLDCAMLLLYIWILYYIIHGYVWHTNVHHLWWRPYKPSNDILNGVLIIVNSTPLYNNKMSLSQKWYIICHEWVVYVWDVKYREIYESIAWW